MEKVFVSPAKYVQGKGVLSTGISHVKSLGDKGLLLCDDVVWGIVGEEFKSNLEKAGMTITRVPFNGEASTIEINRVTEIAKTNQCNVVIGLGGGKTIDSAKAISDNLTVPVAVVPTIASTDAPTSALSVIYSEEGVFEQYLFYKKNPELVLLDTAVVSKAPCRLLASGIADALATWVEGRSVIEAHGKTMGGATPTLAAEAIAAKCEDVLFTNAFQAMEACRANVVTPALEAVVEANTLLSGIGFESCGLAAAHAIHNGFTALHGEIHTLTHGEKVAYGTLTQLFLENKPKAMLDKFIAFYQALELPTTLKDLKIENITYEELLKVGKLATQDGETIHQMAADFSAEDVTDALFAVDAYVQSLK
ncbi:glycerol dehydrogenase [Enterococcus sp. PF1-24]|uniref:glycerol dehydrogenase n=1 Tax=unclassified Enterococcus TaxID=2608891 RepID=UPI002475FF0C|nr:MULTISPECIES: glycerol dehydrogenase [unclassified Enterococcus]MDH6363220.1 glycerol dehydrogenase [Enterococcus sp. PFB1-1]MDH6400479.1 glycerol dehydrogenase [Enterococcus sp. PF1-24]